MELRRWDGLLSPAPPVAPVRPDACRQALSRREVRSSRAEELPGVCASGCGRPSSGLPVELRLWDGLLSPAPPAAPRLWLGASPRG